MNTMIAVGRGVKTPLFYVGTLNRIRNSGYKFNHTKEVMIILQYKRLSKSEFVREEHENRRWKALYPAGQRNDHGVYECACQRSDLSESG